MRGAAATKICAIVTMLVAARALPAQAIARDELTVRKMPYIPRAGYTFQANANLVEAGVVVRDNLGRVVPGLQKQDFGIYENGTEYEITSFSVQTSAATESAGAARKRGVALVLDDIVRDDCGMHCKAIQIADFLLVKDAAQRYARQGLRTGDQISVFGLYAGQVQGFTSDPEKVASGIAKVDPRIQRQKTQEETMGEIERIVQYLAKLPDERMLLVASGNLGGGHLYQNELISLALHAGATINCIDTRGLTDKGLSSNDTMARMAAETGGEYFYQNNNMLRGMRETMAPAVKYLLGFERPDVHDGRYHPLKVKLSGKHNYEVTARPGYFAPAANEAAASMPTDIEDAVLARGARTDIAAWITLQSHSLDPATPAVAVTAHIDLKSIAFRDVQGRHNQKVMFVAALFDANNRLVTGNEAALDFTLRPRTLDHLKAAGINCTLRLTAARGNYRLRTIIHEENGGMTTSDQPVEIQ